MNTTTGGWFWPKVKSPLAQIIQWLYPVLEYLSISQDILRSAQVGYAFRYLTSPLTAGFKAESPMRHEKIVFNNQEGLQLAGRLELPTGPPRAFAIFAHCFTCSKNSVAATRISRKLTDDGFAVLRFDFTGLGSSEGDFSNTNFSSNIRDIVAAASHLRDHFAAPQLLIGHSLGGTAMLAAANSIDEVEAVVTIGSPAAPTHVKHLLCNVVDQLTAHGEAPVTIGGQTFTIKQQLIDDLEASKVEHTGTSASLLVLHSPLDEVVDVDQARQIYTAARGYKSFVSLADADHLLTKPADSQYAAGIIGAWATRYITDRRPAPAEPHEGNVLVEEWQSPYTNRVAARGHSLLADEPTRVGGLDAGPNPYEYLLAALGACTSMTLRMYAQRKQWPVDKISVELRHERVHAKDCEDCDSPASKIDQFECVLEIAGDALTDAQRQRLLEIATRCPVHRTLKNEKEIVTTLAPNKSA